MKPLHLILACACAALLAGCSTYYRVLQETPPPAFGSYQKIFVGWIDLDERMWKKYGYGSIGEWQAAIGGANRMSLPGYFREFMPDRTIATASSARDADPGDADLYIRFSNVSYIASEDSGPRGGAAVVIGPYGSGVSPTVYVNELDVLAVTIDFIDVKQGKSVYTASVLVSSGSASGFSGWTLEGRINNAFYNTVRFIDRTLKGKKK